MIPNFRWLLPGKLAGSSIPSSEEDVRFLTAQGIRAVISLESTFESVSLELERQGMRRLLFSIDEEPEHWPGPDELSVVAAFAQTNLGAGRPVLVHCSAGIQRTGRILVYLIEQLFPFAREATLSKDWTPRSFVTVGYGGRSPKELVRLLKDAEVGTVVDVRLRPDRAALGTFVRARTPDKGIVKLLRDEGVVYESLIELGNPYYEREEWVAPYRALLHLAGPLLTQRLADFKLPFALMCAEKSAEDCHRKVIADYLVEHGMKLERHL